MHNMVTELTRRLMIREGAKLAPTLYEHLDVAVVETRRALRLPERKYPHLHAYHRRAVLREGLEREMLPDGWKVDGNSRLGGQTILSNRELGASLRFLSESSVTANGVPHAGHSQARREQWYVPAAPLFPREDDRHMLLLMGLHGEPSLRIVHPIEPGRYNGYVACDFGIQLLRSEHTVAGEFVGDEEHTEFFVTIDAEESSDA